MNAFEPIEVPAEEAVEEARNLVDAACDWCGENEVEHDEDGWNQDPEYFVRDVAASVEFLKNRGKYPNVERRVKGETL